MSQPSRKSNQKASRKPGPGPSQAHDASRADAGPAGQVRPWSIGQPTFESDRVCPLMPVWPWGGHRGWSYDLVRFMRPPVICELGVHWGTSFFAFAQALKDDRIKADLIGVDTWAGDGHTGPYGPDVLDAVRTIAKASFPKQKFELLQMTFDQALPKVADGSVDLMHIDGFHTYDAVKHDFESWLPKLAPDGIILLHDVAPETGYGSADYWKELQARYGGFSFPHSWGLGVVFPKGDKWLKLLREQGLDDKVPLYTYRAELERSRIEVRDTGQLAVERLGTIEQMGKTIAELKRNEWSTDYGIEQAQAASELLRSDLDAAAKLAADRLAAMDDMGRTIFDLQSNQGELAGRVEQLESDLKSASDLAMQRLGAIDEMGQTIFAHRRRQEESAVQLRELRATLEELRRDLDSANQVAVERLGAIESMGAEIFQAQQLEASARARAQELKNELEHAQRDLKSASALAVERLASMEEMGRAIHGLQEQVNTQAAQADALRRDLRAHQERADRAESDLAAETVRADAELARAIALQAELAEKQAMIEELSRSVTDLQADVELIAMRLEHLERIQIEREDSEARDRKQRGESGPRIAPPRRASGKSSGKQEH